MGRRPAKSKHRGVKDPYKQNEEKFNKIKHMVDRKPVDDQKQEIPRKLQAIVDFQKKVYSDPELVILAKEARKRKKMKMKMKKKMKKDGTDQLIDTARFVPVEKRQTGMERPLKMIPRLVQSKSETDRAFLRRMYKASEVMKDESKFEDEYDVDIVRYESGGVKGMKRRTKLDDPLLPEKVRAELEERNKTRKEKKKERDYRRKHKNKKKEDDDEFTYFQDKVEFGEVVYEPPSLDTKRFSKLNNGQTKTKSFLFMEKLQGSQTEKMPELTVSRKRTLEEERLKAVKAYREMKAAKYKTHNMNLSFG